MEAIIYANLCFSPPLNFLHREEELDNGAAPSAQWGCATRLYKFSLQ